MSRDELQVIWKGATKIHKPMFLAEKWELRFDPNPSVEKFISDMREQVLSPKFDDPKTAPAYAARFMVAFLQRFEHLVETGKLDEVLPRLSGLPILYSPLAGKGAGEWKYAAEICADKRVGSDCILEYRNSDSELARSTTWRHLAYDSVWVVQDAALKMPTFRLLRERKTAHIHISKKISKEAKRAFQADFFILPNKELLVWPDWLDACDAIPRREENGPPVPVKEAKTEYVRAARAVLDNFFADPDHPYAEEIVAAVTGVRKLHRAQAVAEARKNILQVVQRL